jgi:hypothetical protein
MMELLLHVPADLLQRLQEEAESQKISLEEVVLGTLRRGMIGARDRVAEAGRWERFIRESGLFAPPHQKLGPGLLRLAREVPPEERDRLAEALSRGRSLSEMVIEDRG